MSEGSGESQQPANSGQGQGVQATLFTQDQVNHFNAEAKRGAVAGFFKELGLDTVPSADELKKTLADAGEYTKQQQGQLGDVERLTGQLGEANKKAEQVPALEADLLKARIAADAGLKSKYWKYVEGKTEDEIGESVRSVLADVGGREDGGQPPPPGRPPEPNPQQGRGGGQPSGKTLQAGRDAYVAKHKKEQQ